MPAVLPLVCSALLQACALQEEAQLVPANATIGSKFGQSVDAGSDRVIVGAPGQPSPLGGARGAVYVYDRIGPIWVQQAELGDVTYPSPYGLFGFSVSLDGDQLAVGAPEVYAPAQYGFGAAYVFKRVAGTWTQETIITPSAPVGDYIVGAGRSVDLLGDTLLVGCAYKVTPDPQVRGRALVYTRGPTGWTQQWVMKFDAIDPSETALGVSVLLHGDEALIGSPIANGVEPLAGAVYVYQRIGSAWFMKQKLVASDGRTDDMFGWSLAGDGDTILVGAWRADHPLEADTGAAYVFVRLGKQWVESRKLTSTSHEQFDQTGASVAVDDGAFVLGASGYSRLFLFTRNGNNYLEHLQIEPKNGYLGQVGRSVSMFGGTLAVGAPATPAGTGSAYVYSVDTSNLIVNYYCSPKPTAGNCDPQIHHVNQPSVTGSLVGEKYVVRAIPVHGQSKGMLMYSTSGPASLPYQGGTLCINPPVSRTILLDTHGTGPCWGILELDFNTWISSGQDPSLKAGQQVWFQYWYRDPASTTSSTLGLTAGLSAVICP